MARIIGICIDSEFPVTLQTMRANGFSPQR